MEGPRKVRAAAIFAALGHPTRISIVQALSEREMSVGELSAALGLGQSSASQHLAALLRAGVLAVTPKGTSRHYRVRGPRMVKMLLLMDEFCEVQGLSGEPEDDAIES